VQSVPRSELTALCLVIEKVEAGGTVDFFTDSKITKDTFNKGVERARFAANSELWVQLFQNIKDKHITVQVYWMPSHTKDDPAKKAKAPLWMKEWHVKGNDQADANADMAAALHTVPRDTAKGPLKVVSNLKLMQERHCAVAKLFPARQRNTVKNEEQMPSRNARIYKAIRDSPHIAVQNGSRIHCTDCNMSVSVRATHLLDILQAPCIPECKHISYPVGNLFTHVTHSVVIYGGVFFCTACGATAKNKLVKLDRPCMPVRHGTNYNLTAYKFGRAPAGFPGWPYKHVTSCLANVRGTIQAAVDQLAVAQREQMQAVSSEEEWPDSDDSGPLLSPLSPDGSSSEA